MNNTTVVSPPALPGPWAFLTSAYIIGLLVVAVLVHRIHHIVVPRRRSSSLVRLALRLPPLFFLLKSLVFWSSILALPTWLHRDTPSLCWLTFCSACAALCVESLTRALEGASASASPFNLFGYAFLLHIYSSPVTHATKLQGLPSRPDKHAVFTIIIPLLQLTVLHALGMKQSWSNLRLIPSAFASILALLHFHWVIWFSDATYPLLNYMPCVFESILLFLTFLAIFLNAFTQIVTEGTLSRPLFGHRAALLPRPDEDFSIALLRMATASLETSSLAGLGNEVTAIPLTSSSLDVPTVHLTRLGVSHTLDDTHTKGFTNEIKNIRAAVDDDGLWLDLTWYHEFVSFSIELVRFVKRSYASLRHFLSAPSSPETVHPPLPDQVEHVDVYDRFIRGEQLSDDECDEYAPSRSSSVESFSSLSDNAESTLYDDQADAIGLYADLSASTSTSHLLAHLIDHSSSPLTRQRFNQLLSTPLPPDSKDDWIEVMHARKLATFASKPEEDTRRNCVICTVEPRQIICWPCRCLALCDDCRENLASRASVSKHMCPCCRTSVQGYSKIYIP